MRQHSHPDEHANFNPHGDQPDAPAASSESCLGFSKPQEAFDPLAKFLNQVVQQPETIAVVFNQEHVTYHELNHRANQVAHWLQSKGVGPECIVGICLDRSLPLILSILGVIKAGGCLLLLDPSYPPHRLTYMVQNSLPSLLLTQKSYEDLFQDCPTTLIEFTSIQKNLSCKCSHNPASVITPKNLRVIFYTSGSTGQPKGVMEVNRRPSQTPEPDEKQLAKGAQSTITSADRMLVKCPMSFAPFLWEVIEPLFAGGTLIMANPGGEQDFFYLVQLLANEGVTVAHFVPSSLRILLEQPEIHRCTALALVCCSGEILPDSLRDEFFTKLQADIDFTYAATEAPGAASIHLQRGNFKKPFSLNQKKSAKIFVLNSNRYPTPIEEHGELYIEDSERIRGYFKQPVLTAEKFVPHPFSSTPGSRLYRTGDTAKILSDGNFEIVGRKDQQVKIRGHRIELGEIESVLHQQPEVRKAVVMVWNDQQEAPRLVAYISMTEGYTFNQVAITQSLSQQIPSYMIPTFFVEMDSFPLTPNGKIDKKALFPAETITQRQNTPYCAPTTALEEWLVELWEEILSIQQIGIHDNFFQLGGHSLLATTCVARLREILEFSVPLRTIFDKPTIAELAQVIETQIPNHITD